MDRATTNGGFPLPLAGEPVRVLTSHHDACDGQTRVRLPSSVPSRAVRRVVCDRCAERYEPPQVVEVEADARRWALPAVSLPRPSIPRLSIPELAVGGATWRWLSLPVAAAAVLGVLYLLQGDGDDGAAPARDQLERRAGTIAAERPARVAEVPGDAELISESTFQLALPAGWTRLAPSGGATFAAAAPDGDADAMLWIERDPKLSFAEFETRSLAQLESLAGSAKAIEHNLGPTPAQTTATLAPTSAPDSAPNYEVLISGGPASRWYYLATTSQPSASPETVAAIELIQGSFLPQGGGR